jgi:hypothetical protein
MDGSYKLNPILSYLVSLKQDASPHVIVSLNQGTSPHVIVSLNQGTSPHVIILRLIKSDHNPSYVWRNISELISVSGGVRWCIGTCSSIPILNEMWIQNGRCIDSNMPGTFMFKKFTNNSFIYVAHKR